MARHLFQIEQNAALLDQGLALLTRLDDAVYAGGHRAGAHLRHVLEFYECFLNGLDSSHIDYSSRKRDETIEKSRAAAMGRLRSLMARLRTNPALIGDGVVWVKLDDYETAAPESTWMVSSLSRELHYLTTHTIHHYALIASALKPCGVEMDRDFGVAPSTLRYRASRQAA